MNEQELRQLTLSEAQVLIKNRELVPADLVNAYLNRIKETEPAVNAFTEVYFDDAAREAEELSAQPSSGPLFGIPVALKDNIALKGRRTTAGSKVLADNITAEDAPVAQRLKASGAVIVGKTNMHEFAMGATTDSPLFGSTHNPWNLERFCCGSSGGSGAAVANGSALAALGTDTGGSVRLPSSVCGIVGLRPTLGRVPIRGIIPAAYTFDACGPMTRNVLDNAILLNTMAGYEKSDPSTSPEPVADYTALIGQGLKGKRFGILPDYLFRQDQPDVVHAVQNAFDIFRGLGAEIVERRIEQLDLLPKAWYAICAAEAATVHQQNIRTRAKDYSSDVRAALETGELLPATAYIQAQRYRRWLREAFDRAFRDVDYFLFPTLPATAVPIGQYDLVINGKQENILRLTSNYIFFAPMAGLPALSLPCGLDREGLPIGLQILGRPFGEAALYQAGAAFETCFNLHKLLPAVR